MPPPGVKEEVILNRSDRFMGARLVAQDVRFKWLFLGRDAVSWS